MLILNFEKTLINDNGYLITLNNSKNDYDKVLINFYFTPDEYLFKGFSIYQYDESQIDLNNYNYKESDLIATYVDNYVDISYLINLLKANKLIIKLNNDLNTLNTLFFDLYYDNYKTRSVSYPLENIGQLNISRNIDFITLDFPVFLNKLTPFNLNITITNMPLSGGINIIDNTFKLFKSGTIYDFTYNNLSFDYFPITMKELRRLKDENNKILREYLDTDFSKIYYCYNDNSFLTLEDDNVIKIFDNKGNKYLFIEKDDKYSIKKLIFLNGEEILFTKNTNLLKINNKNEEVVINYVNNQIKTILFNMGEIIEFNIFENQINYIKRRENQQIERLLITYNNSRVTIIDNLVTKERLLISYLDNKIKLIDQRYRLINGERKYLNKEYNYEFINDSISILDDEESICYYYDDDKINYKVKNGHLVSGYNYENEKIKDNRYNYKLSSISLLHNLDRNLISNRLNDFTKMNFSSDSSFDLIYDERLKDEIFEIVNKSEGHLKVLQKIVSNKNGSYKLSFKVNSKIESQVFIKIGNNRYDINVANRWEFIQIENINLTSGENLFEIEVPLCVKNVKFSKFELTENEEKPTNNLICDGDFNSLSSYNIIKSPEDIVVIKDCNILDDSKSLALKGDNIKVQFELPVLKKGKEYFELSFFARAVEYLSTHLDIKVSYFNNDSIAKEENHTSYFKYKDNYKYFNYALNCIYDYNKIKVELSYEEKKEIRIKHLALVKNFNYETLCYDSFGDLVKIESNDYHIERKYDKYHNVVSEKDSEGFLNSYEYDNKGRLIRKIDGFGNEINFSYDIKNLDDYDISASYDHAIIAITYNSYLKNREKCIYLLDEKENILGLAHYVEENGVYKFVKETKSSYDNLNRVIKNVDALDNNYLYSYNSFDSLTKVELVNNESSLAHNNIAYNEENDILNVNNVISNYFYEYDNFRRLINVKYKDKSLVTYTYNNKDLITSKNQTNYEYDEKKRLIKETNGNQILSESFYDNLDNVTKVKDYLNNEETKYVYDAYNNIIGKYNSFFTEDYNYDEDGNIVNINSIHSNLNHNSNFVIKSKYNKYQRNKLITNGYNAKCFDFVNKDNYQFDNIFQDDYENGNLLLNRKEMGVYDYFNNGRYKTLIIKFKVEKINEESEPIVRFYDSEIVCDLNINNGYLELKNNNLLLRSKEKLNYQGINNLIITFSGDDLNKCDIEFNLNGRKTELRTFDFSIANVKIFKIGSYNNEVGFRNNTLVIMDVISLNSFIDDNLLTLIKAEDKGNYLKYSRNGYEVFPLTNHLFSNFNNVIKAEGRVKFENSQICLNGGWLKLDHKINSPFVMHIRFNFTSDKPSKKLLTFVSKESNEITSSVLLANNYLMVSSNNYYATSNELLKKDINYDLTIISKLGKETKFYINGSLVLSRNINIVDTYLYIGNDTKTLDTFFEGYVSNLCIKRNEEKNDNLILSDLKELNVKHSNDYDSLDRLINKNIEIKDKVMSNVYTYNNLNLISEEKLLDGTRKVYTYDKLNRVTKVQTYEKLQLPSSLNYYYDAQGRIVKEEKIEGLMTLITTFLYDSNNNILNKKVIRKVRNATGIIENVILDDDYIYDNLKRDLLIKVSSKIDNKDKKIINYDGLFPSYINGQKLEYQGNKLIKLGTSNYKYDVNGLRISKEKVDKNYYYYYQGNLLIIEKVIDKIENTEVIIKYHYDINGSLVSFEVNDEIYFYIRDLLGNILKIVDKEGREVVRYSYNSHGEVTKTIKENRTLASYNSFVYKGYYYDDETQLYWVSSRYYSPELCRWISPDSIEYLDPQSING